MSLDASPYWLTDAGLETWLIFKRGLELRDFAAFELLQSAPGRAALTDYYTPFLQLAANVGAGFILETPTWRASSDWGARLGYSDGALAEINAMAVGFCKALAKPFPDLAIQISGNMGPRGDGYRIDTRMAPREARAYHKPQVEALAAGGADLVSAITLGYTEEAIGISQAAAEADMPCVIAFTLETDGRLPSGTSLAHAIETVDEATGGYPAHYMINCAHPDHFAHVLEGDWTGRIKGVRANASRQSHAELDACETLDDGDPQELATLYAKLARLLPNLKVMGGCCGTDHRHIAAICAATHAA